MAADKALPPEQVLLSYPDAGRILGISKSTVRNLTLRGKLTPVEFLGVKRIPRREVERLLTEIGAA
ncbi:helix-turn-helix domain-containing protein [Bosea sp. MMO-172]|uniref:helix-turn-helix domain-containing protein n=1 Tax=Bosea sp. MMO-172 TaxID=3127885 RepID=UPI003017EBCF